VKVLIVDDSKDIRRMIKHFIKKQVDEFVECEDGAEAVEFYRRHSPDVVLMDIKMRTVDGLEATRQMKAEYPQARIVIVSQWDTQALRNSAREAGAVTYVNKSDLLPLRKLLESIY
jgi:two-component system chemotaxis response regulator CheY